jgi:hypothetical protein
MSEKLHAALRRVEAAQRELAEATKLLSELVAQEEDIPGLEIPEGILSTPDPPPPPPRYREPGLENWHDPYGHVDETPKPPTGPEPQQPATARPRPPRLPGRIYGGYMNRPEPPKSKEVRPDSEVEDIPGLEIPDGILSTPDPAPPPPRHGAFSEGWHDPFADVDERRSIRTEPETPRPPHAKPRPPRLPGRVYGEPQTPAPVPVKDLEVRPDADDECPDLVIPDGIMSTPDPPPRPRRHGNFDMADYHDPFGDVDETPAYAVDDESQRTMKPRPPRLPGRIPGGSPTIRKTVNKEVRPDADDECPDLPPVSAPPPPVNPLRTVKARFRPLPNPSALRDEAAAEDRSALLAAGYRISCLDGKTLVPPTRPTRQPGYPPSLDGPSAEDEIPF